MQGLQELRILAPYIGNDFVRVGRHEAGRVDEHPVQLRRVRKAIPVHLLHLPRFVGMEKEVAAGGAPREREGGARIDDTRSCHAASM